MGKPHCSSILRATDNSVWSILYSRFSSDDFEVVATVREALSRIATEDFDLLLSDLHMPHAADGFTVVSAMPHTHPEAVTLVSQRLSALLSCCSWIGQSRGQTS